MNPPFTITNKMLNLIVDITHKITQLNLEKKRNLHLRKDHRIKSIYSSLAIEQNTLSINQVSDVINGKRVFGDPKEIKEVINAYNAYNTVFSKNPYSIDDFLYIHNLLTIGLVKESGKFRSKDVGVYDSTGNLIHLGAREQFIKPLMEELFTWAKTSDVAMLIKSCVVHFEIEMIHPFQDGNGRMGRLWQNLILSKWMDSFEWIPIESIIYKHQQKYYKMLNIGDKENDSTKFIEFMLEVILETISEYNHSENIDFNFIDESIKDKLSDKEYDFLVNIYPYIQKHNSITNGQAVKLTKRSASTTRRYLNKFVELGILKAIGQNKGRIYMINS